MKGFYLAIVLLAGSGALFAQSDRGTITGRIVDPSGAPIPNAVLTASRTATGIKYPGSTTDSGNYSIQQLPIGVYELTAEASGFRRYVRKDINVNVAQTLTININLEVGTVEQTLEVTADGPVIESSTSDLGTVISRERVMDLPLSVSGNMRNPESFIFLTPGVTGDASNTQINGSQSRAKEVVLDGAGSTTPESGGTLFTYPSVEALGEFKLLSSNFSAEYGRTGGGFEIFTTKSGTNELHGAVFDYLHNDVLDARGFFARTTPINRQNEFGLAVGGPIVIPRFYNGRNKSFFHFVYSGFRYRAGATNQLLSIPTEDFKRGDFSKLVDRNGKQIPIYDAATTKFDGTNYTRDQFAGNIIPQSRFSSVAKAILPLIPSPTLPGTLQNYLAIGAQTFDRDQYDIKIDHALSDRSRLSGFAYIGSQDSVEPERLPVPLSGAQAERRPSRWIRLNHDYIFSASTLNHFVAGFTREGQYWSRLSADQDWPGKLGLNGVATGAGNAFPLILFSDGFTNWADNTTAGLTASINSKSVGSQVNNTWQLTDNVSHIRGPHSLKFGVDLRRQETNGADFFLSQGRFEFSNNETAFPTAAGRASSGNGFASFLLGTVDRATENILAVVPSNRYKYFGTYVQDDWKVSQKLTLNIGLRYEIFFPRTERFGNLSGFDPTIPNPGAGNRPGAIVFLGDGTGRSGRSSFADTYYKAFGPRLGFAYALTAKTAIRGGYGIYYAPGNGTAGLRQSQAFGFGFNASPVFQTTNTGIDPAFNWDAGFPQNFARPPFIDPTTANNSDVNFIGRNDARPPDFQNFTFSVQHELPSSILVELAYVGVKGTHLGTGITNINEVDPQYLNLGSQLTQPASNLPYPGFKGSVAQALRPYPQYLKVENRSNPNGNSTYHALQTKLEKRLSHGLTFLGAYTWSKSISDSDIQAGGGTAGQTYYNRRLEKAISINDVPHNFVFSYLYELPFGHGKRWLTSGVGSRVFGGWTLTGIHQYSSGKPIVLTANNTLPLFNAVLRPDVIPGVSRVADYGDKFDPQTERQINTAAFAAPTGFRFGTAARSYTDLRAFPYLNESFGAIKRTNLTERVLLTFRAEFFNAFNRTVFGAPEGNVSNVNFGRVSRQANTPRQGQLALRLEF